MQGRSQGSLGIAPTVCQPCRRYCPASAIHDVPCIIVAQADRQAGRRMQSVSQWWLPATPVSAPRPCTHASCPSRPHACSRLPPPTQPPPHPPTKVVEELRHALPRVVRWPPHAALPHDHPRAHLPPGVAAAGIGACAGSSGRRRYYALLVEPRPAAAAARPPPRVARNSCTAAPAAAGAGAAACLLKLLLLCRAAGSGGDGRRGERRGRCRAAEPRGRARSWPPTRPGCGGHGHGHVVRQQLRGAQLGRRQRRGLLRGEGDVRELQRLHHLAQAPAAVPGTLRGGVGWGWWCAHVPSHSPTYPGGAAG